jgi:protein SCO1/2
MKNISRRAWLRIGTGAAVGAGLLVGPGGRDKSWASASPRDSIRARFPNVLLTTHEGKKVRFYDDLIKDKFVTINFVYTSCTVTCPVTMANLLRAQKILKDRVGRDLFMYSITLDPEHDRPEVLKKYAQTHGVQPGWLFLTGTREAVRQIRRGLGMELPDPTADSFKDNHIGILRYGNERYMRWGAVPTIANPSWIAKAILFADWPENRKAAR